MIWVLQRKATAEDIGEGSVLSREGPRGSCWVTTSPAAVLRPLTQVKTTRELFSVTDARASCQDPDGCGLGCGLGAGAFERLRSASSRQPGLGAPDIDACFLYFNKHS